MLRRVLLLSASGPVAALAYARLVAIRRLGVRHLRIGIPDLPEEWQGMRIAHLSDFHAGSRGTSLSMLHRARGMALAFSPDVVALTGDFYDNARPVETGGLWSGWPADIRVVAVLGNHDFRADPRTIVDELTNGGVKVLRNEAVSVELRGRSAWVVGVDDPFTQLANESAAFGGVPDTQDALLYLAHSPAIDDEYPLGRARLVLSGHTHGGQIRLLPSGRIPGVRIIRAIWKTPPRRDPPVFRGCRLLRGSIVVVSSGLGVSRIPMRFGTRPEVVLIELAGADPHGPDCDDVRRYVTEPRL